MSPTPSGPQAESWENEGGGLVSASPEDLGISRITTEMYEVGGYRYTQLADAVAQAQRMLKAETGQ